MFVIDFPILDSTNKYLKENYQTYDSFTFVSALEQTSGKGREDRVWESNKGENLLFSVLLKDPQLTSKFEYLSLATAYAVTRVLEEFGFDDVKIKWPNDVYIGGKKVCGILLEGSLPEYLVIGVGLNVNQESFIGDFRTSPTSLKIEAKKVFDLNTVKTRIYQQIVVEFTKIAENNSDFLKSIKHYDFLKNKDVIVSSYNSEKVVHVVGIQDDASLLILDNEKLVKINSGEVVKIL